VARLAPRVVLGAAIAAAACSDPSTAPTAAPGRDLSPSAPSLQGAPNPDVIPDRHIAPPHGPKSDPSDALYVGRVTKGTIYNHGGPVLQAGTKVVAVYWAGSTIYTGGPAAGATGTGAQDGSLIGSFLRSIGGSPYFNINTTYTNSAGTHITNSVSYVGFWANNSYNVPTGTQSVSDAQMLDMLQYGFNNGKLTYDPNTLYIIFSAGSVNLGGGFGSSYCAYHTHGNVNLTSGGTKTVLYSAMPYNASNGSCIAQTTGPNGDAADPEVSVVAHETEETTTDMMANAWYDLRGYENADKCAWTWGATKTASNGAAYNLTLTDPLNGATHNFLVQQNWVAPNGGCAMSH
jgi:hypothetical protein